MVWAFHEYGRAIKPCPIEGNWAVIESVEPNLVGGGYGFVAIGNLGFLGI
jgi:hypothetical protein